MPASVATRVIGHAAALDLAARAVAHAAERGWCIAVVVLDPAGEVVAALRMAGGPPLILSNATDKAWTAVMLGMASKRFAERVLAEPGFAAGARSRPRLLAWEGGLPIREDGVLVGAIGVSGARGHEDAECAHVALAALGLAGEP